MTKDELTIYRLQAEMELHRLILRNVLKMVQTMPGYETAPKHLADQLTSELAKVVLPGLKPGYSDLLAAECQDIAKALFDGL